MLSRITHKISDSFSTLVRLWPYMTENNGKEVHAAFWLGILGPAFNILSTLTLTQLINALETDETIDIAGIKISPRIMTALMTFTYFAGKATPHLRNWLIAALGPATGRAIKARHIALLMNQPVTQFKIDPTGMKIGSLVTGFNAGKEIAASLFGKIFPASVEITAILGLLADRYGPVITLELFAILFISAIHSVMSRKSISQTNNQENESTQAMFDGLNEILDQYVTIQINNTVDNEVEKEIKLTDMYAKRLSESAALLAKLATRQSVITYAGFMAMFLQAANDVLKGKTGLSPFIFLVVLLLQLGSQLEEFSLALSKALAFAPAAKNALDSFDALKAQLPQHEEKEFVMPELGGPAIEFNNVHFSYMDESGDEKPVLKGISFTIQPGERVAFVGPSGSGKSTVAGLLFKFIEPKEGTIIINNQNIADVSTRSFRKEVAMIPQQPALFNKTVGYNVIYGAAHPENVSDNEIEHALKIASITDFDLNTPVGERGSNLSGGQKQRVAIAMAILRNATLLLLDEATSALDSVTQETVNHQLKKYAQEEKLTSVEITHKYANLQDVDKIFVLNEGLIAEQGTHEQLVEIENGIYKGLWEKQLLESAQGIAPVEELKSPAKSRSSLFGKSGSDNRSHSRSQDSIRIDEPANDDCIIEMDSINNHTV